MDEVRQQPQIVVRRIPGWLRAALFVVDLVGGVIDWSTMARVELKQPDGTRRPLCRWTGEPYARWLASECQKQIDDGDETFDPPSEALSWWWRSRSPWR